MNQWKMTDNNEMLFLGMLMWTGLVKMLTFENYWRQCSLYKNSVAAVTMNRNRIQALLRTWHYTNNLAVSNGDITRRVHKIRPMINLLVAKFQNAKVPEE